MTGDAVSVDTGVDGSGGPTVGSLPKRLRSSRAKLVYLYLHTVGGARLEELEDTLGMGTLALFPILGVLVDHGLVERIDGRYVVTTEDEP